MESEKLTLEWCFKYPSGVIVNQKKEWLVVREYLILYPHYRFDLPQCKLQLRPLSSLTEEEKKVIQKWLPDDLDLKDVELYELFGIILDVVSFEDLIKFYDYLRSINIDIDGLKEKGIAVYE